MESGRPRPPWNAAAMFCEEFLKSACGPKPMDPQRQVGWRSEVQRVIVAIALGDRRGAQSPYRRSRWRPGQTRFQRKEKSPAKKKARDRESAPVLLRDHAAECSSGEAARKQHDVPDTRGLTNRESGLRFVAQTLLVAVLLHALAALMFGDLRFATFLQ